MTLEPAPPEFIRSAFDWVASEVEFGDQAYREALYQAFARQPYDHRRAVQAMDAAWTGNWKSGERFLRSRGWRPDEEIGEDEEDDYDGESLMELLYGRLAHVLHRLLRNEQILSIIEAASKSAGPITHFVINRDDWPEQRHCGPGVRCVVTLAVAMEMLHTPAHAHPACQCSIDPIWPSDRERYGLPGL